MIRQRGTRHQNTGLAIPTLPAKAMGDGRPQRAPTLDLFERTIVGQVAAMENGRAHSMHDALHSHPLRRETGLYCQVDPCQPDTLARTLNRPTSLVSVDSDPSFKMPYSGSVSR